MEETRPLPTASTRRWQLRQSTEPSQVWLISKARKKAEIHVKGSNATLILQCKVVYTYLLTGSGKAAVLWLCLDTVLVGVVMVVVAIVMQSDAVELEERVCDLVSWRR